MQTMTSLWNRAIRKLQSWEFVYPHQKLVPSICSHWKLFGIASSISFDVIIIPARELKHSGYSTPLKGVYNAPVDLPFDVDFWWFFCQKPGKILGLAPLPHDQGRLPIWWKGLEEWERGGWVGSVFLQKSMKLKIHYKSTSRPVPQA